MNKVYWITGLSGAGKTTIGKLFYEKLRKEHGNTLFLDGDMLRQVFGDDLGYSEEDRRKCAMRYSRLCNMLQKQGMNVVCCTISMFDSVREWNRKNILSYCEIYIKVSMQTLQERDQKGLYSSYLQGKEKELAGVQVGMEEPRHPDLILQNDGEKTPDEQVEAIMEFIKKADRSCPVCGEKKAKVLKKINMAVPENYRLPDSYEVVVCEECGCVYANTRASMEDYDWYYTHCNFYGDDCKDDDNLRFEITQELLEKYVSKDAVILEMGAGNGFFIKALKKHGYSHVTGTDPSDESVRRLREAGIQTYVSDVYAEVLPEEKEKYDCIFLFEVAEHLLFPGRGISNIAKMLKIHGIFMISVPDYSKIEGDLTCIPNYFNLEHINYFSEASLDYLMSLHGMKRVSQKRVGVDLMQVYQKVGEREGGGVMG